MKLNSKKIVYIVDDDPDDRQIILDAFIENDSRLDYVFIENGEQLMDALHAADRSELPSLIMLDLNMPGMMGLQALKEIKTNKNFSYIPTIVLTTSVLPKDKTSSYELGANCFIRKPELYGDLLELTGSIVKLWFRE